MFSKVIKNFRKLKLVKSKAMTLLALKIVTRNKKDSQINIIKNVSYGKSKLQKYDIIYPITSKQTLPIIFYVHGGSWGGGDKFGYTSFCCKLAKQNFICVNINYRLMPKVGLRVTMLDCVRAIKHFVENNTLINKDNQQIFANNKQVFMVGDSAGAQIVSLICAKLTYGKIDLDIKPLALGLYYGVYDFNNLSKDPSLILRNLDKYLKCSTKDSKKLYKDFSTTTYLTKNFPPCFLTTGEVDKLHSQTKNFEKLLTNYKIKHDYLCFEHSRKDGAHCFLNMPMLKSSKQAFERLSKFFKEQLAGENIC